MARGTSVKLVELRISLRLKMHGASLIGYTANILAIIHLNPAHCTTVKSATSSNEWQLAPDLLA